MNNMHGANLKHSQASKMLSPCFDGARLDVTTDKCCLIELYWILLHGQIKISCTRHNSTVLVGYVNLFFLICEGLYAAYICNFNLDYTETAKL